MKLHITMVRCTSYNRHVLNGGVESWSEVLETPSWSGVLKTPSWSIVYDFSIDVFCKLGIVDDY
jgi:hypothetical protein